MKSGKKLLWMFLVVLAMGVLSSARASRKSEITLILVPRTEAMVQLGKEISDRYPSLLITYALDASGEKVTALYGWAGSQWVVIKPESFAEGKFFHNPPDSALIIEPEDQPAPEALIPPAAWCPAVAKITTTQLRPLLHLVGQYFDFDYKEWKWFAERYHMEIDAINPEHLNIKWYDQPLAAHLDRKAVPDASQDLQYWQMVREVVPPEPATSPEEEEKKEAPTGNEKAAEPPAEAVDNPLTNAVTPAVILGAPDAPAEEADEEVLATEEAAKPKKEEK